MAQSRFCMHCTLKTQLKILSAFPSAIPPARFARRGGHLLCLAGCYRRQRSMTMQPNLLRPFRPMRIICAGIDLVEIQPWTDGKNLLPLIENAASAH